MAALLQTAAIGARCIATHRPPMTAPADTISAVGWAVGLLFLALAALGPLRGGRTPAGAAVGVVAESLAFLCVFAGSALRLAGRGAAAGTGTGMAAGKHFAASPPALDGGLVSLHVIALVFAFGLLAIAVGCGSLYLVEDRMLKRKSVAHLLFWRLPPLSEVDALAFRLVAFAFPLLTLGLLAGIVRAAALGAPGAGLMEAHTLASLVTWVAYGAYLWLHARHSWRGPRASALLLIGCAATLATYFAPGTLHQFGG